jgi:peptide/nickel transport system substrate-binding protein
MAWQSKRIVGSLAAVFLLSALAAGVGTAQAASKGSAGIQRGGTLTVGIAQETNTFDVNQTIWSQGLELTYQSLLTHNFKFQFQPSLATSWSESKGGLEWTFQLRKGVKFQDGTPFNSYAVKKDFQIMLDPKYNFADAASYNFIDPNKILTPNPYTITFVLKTPFPDILFDMANTYGGLQSPTAYLKYGPMGTNTYGTQVAVGTGPFKLVQWVPHEQYVFERYSGFDSAAPYMSNQGPPYVSKVIMKIIPDAATRLTQLQTGGVGILVDLPAADAKVAASFPNIKVLKAPGDYLGFLGFNTKAKPFNNVLVREAINHAINRVGIVNALFAGLAEPAYGYFPPTTPGFFQDKQAMSYNIKLARQLLAKAGYPHGLPGTYTLATSNDTELTQVAEAVQPMLAAIGVHTQIQTFSTAHWVSYLKSGKQQLFVYHYEWWDPNILQWFLQSSQMPYPNYFMWDDPKTDQMINSAYAAPSWNAYVQRWDQLAQYLVSKSVWAPIYYPDQLQAVNTSIVHGYKIHPTDIVLNDVWVSHSGSGQ